ncbi:MAG TPA: hypothetical protein VLV88_14765 [Terriglobales bacterium]|nr:hypothetical protein [Terriglobales bacterium]
MPLGPGYAVQKQEIRVRFDNSGRPSVRVEAEYHLKNTGNQPLPSLDVRLPGKSVHTTALAMSWDSETLPLERSAVNPRDTTLELSKPWALGENHTLRIAFEIQEPADGERGLRFARDAFFLPQENWSPVLLPPRGFLASGGLPPAKWNLTVTVPRAFRLHMSGERAKRSQHDGEATFRSQQRPQDRYPFVVAGSYLETAINGGNRKVFLWTRAKPDAKTIRESSESLIRASGAYDSAFGLRGNGHQPLWIVECPEAEGCFTGRNAPYAKLLDLPQGNSMAEMISLDTTLVGQQDSGTKIALAAAPFLAASWLGYGRNPGFFEQQPPLSAFPIFAASLGREAVEGTSVRGEMIRNALSEIPIAEVKGATENPETIRAKSFLFFFALRDRYGEAVFQKAIQHMLTARQGKGFNLDDLIAAFEEETHKNVAQFVRLWMKHPGVPDDFRARYEGKTTAVLTPKEREP